MLGLSSASNHLIFITFIFWMQTYYRILTNLISSDKVDNSCCTIWYGFVEICCDCGSWWSMVVTRERLHAHWCIWSFDDDSRENKCFGVWKGTHHQVGNNVSTAYVLKALQQKILIWKSVFTCMLLVLKDLLYTCIYISIRKRITSGNCGKKV